MSRKVTIDEIREENLKIIQPRHGYRFSLDPILLCDFAGEAIDGAVADLGCGCGIMPLLIARRNPFVRVTGIEKQEELAEIARRNAAMNGLEERITIIESDIMSLSGTVNPGAFDLVVSNPPYRPLGTGRISPRSGRDTARHESTAGLMDFLTVAKRLAVIGGRICFIYHPSRLSELLVAAAELKLALFRLRMVHDHPGADARMFMVELVKGRRGDLQLLPPLFVRNGAEEPSIEKEPAGC